MYYALHDMTESDREMPMNTNRAVEMQFPCTFPIKAMGYADAGLETRVLEIVRHHAPECSEDAVHNRPSVGGKYLSVTVTIEAQSRDQLDAIYQELTNCEQVLVAL
jgi:putative lipoic acid-binding regulatory protein